MAAAKPTSKATSLGPGALAGFALWRDAMAWQREVDRVLRRLRLTHTQLLVLWALDVAFGRSGEAVNQVAIATEAGLDKATVSAVLRTLDSRGFISRDVGFGDRRAWRIVITSIGRRTLALAAPLIEEAKPPRRREEPPAPLVK